MQKKWIDMTLSTLPTGEVYKLLIGAVVPRPIAWVSTVSAYGIANLAPFSFFNAVCSNPPTLLFCPVNHPDGREKDTLRNIRQTQEFVVNVATENVVKALNQTSANYPSDISEFAQAGVTPIPSSLVAAPRVEESPIQFECKLVQVVDVGDGSNGSGHIVIGRIVYAHFDARVYQAGKISIEALKPVGRLAGNSYCPVREVFDLARPLD